MYVANTSFLFRVLLLFVVVAGAAKISVAGSLAANGTPNAPSADPALTLGSGWSVFSWASGDPPTPVFNQEGAFTFTVPAGATENLKVTDAGLDGDQFSVFNFGSPLFTTSVPVDDSTVSSDDDAAFASPKFSHGEIALGPGSYSITLETIVFAETLGLTSTSGAGAIELISAVPEPASVVLCALGTIGLIVAALRRRKA